MHTSAAESFQRPPTAPLLYDAVNSVWSAVVHAPSRFRSARALFAA
ncbi:MAG: hypothetical protein KF699_05785 [Phycisphaeraceae bacterium]|nr:hypothetical protein [Phycisphaeraceae bacterium]